MNDNDNIRDDLSALMDGALDDDRRRELEEAIEKDPALSAEYGRLLRVDALYAELPRETAPEGFAEGVRNAIARRESMTESEPPQRPVKLRMFTQANRRSVFWPLAAAATLLAGFFLWSTMNTANRSNMMLSMNKAASPGNADALKDKEEQPYRVQVMPAEAAKAAPPALAAPEPVQEGVGRKAEAAADQQAPPPSATEMPPLVPLTKQDRERALAKLFSARQATPASPPPPPADANAPAPAPAPAEAESSASATAAGAGPQAPTAAAEKQAEQRKVAGRVFVRADTGWVEQNYKGEVLTELSVDSDEYKALLPTHPPLAQVAALGGTITLRIDGVWRDLKTGRPVTESK